MTAKESSIEEKLGDITECCICAEIYDDPRVLPCIHTFCLKCIQLTGKEKKPGEEMPCPICRTEFIIPTAGFVGLKKNFFMTKLVEMAMLQKPEIRETLCDVCKENTDEEPVSQIATATMYCTDCRDHLCDRCFRDHKRHKLSRDHQVIAFGSGALQQEDIRRFRPSKCEQHVKEQLKLYCLPCKAVLCIMCYVEGHGTHQCNDIEKVAEDFRNDIGKDLDEIEMFLNVCLTEKQEVERYRTEVVTEIEQTQAAVIFRGQTLKELIDNHTDELLKELALIKQSKLKEMEAKNEELTRQQTILDSFKIYCLQMKSKGSSSDICRVIKELQDRTEILRREVTTKKDMQSEQKQMHIFFEPTNLEVFSKTSNVVGALNEETSQEVNPSLFKTVITGDTDDNTTIRGFAILDKHIYIFSSGSSRIEVYDSTSFIFQCQRKVEGLNDPFEMASCNLNKCLYILDGKDDPESMKMMRVDSMGKLINKWSPGEDWGIHLFITKDSNILLPAHMTNRLNEYSPDGQQIRSIKLSSELRYPTHALKIADDKFIVSFANCCMAFDDDDHTSITSECNSEEDSESSDNDRKNLEEEDEEEQKEEEEETEEEEQEEEEVENEEEEQELEEQEEEEEVENEEEDQEEEEEEENEEEGHEEEEEMAEHRVCIIDGNGDVLKSFGHAKGSGCSQLDSPIYMTIDKEAQVIVADSGNSRVLLLGPDLEFRRELITAKQGFRHPRQVQLDSTGRLFVASSARKGHKRIRGSALFFRLK